MVQRRILAVPSPSVVIKDLPEETQNIIRSDLRQYAREAHCTLKWNAALGDYSDMAGRFCDIEKIYQDTELVFCNPGEDVEPYEKSKERYITLKLYSDDMELLCNKAAAGGLTVAELLENFVADLISGAKSNGSDERMYAGMWFERCWFGMGLDTSFLTYVSEWGYADEVLRLWEEFQYYGSLDEPDEYDKEELKEVSEELDEIFTEYRKSAYHPCDEALEEGMKKLLIWNEERKNLLNDDSREV